MLKCGTYSGYQTHGKNKEKPCDECRAAANKYRRDKRIKDNKVLGYDPRRFKRHHITKEIYDKLLNKYKGKCWICKKNEANHIDHDHSCCNDNSFSCGKCIRGVLCSNCNTAIGLFRDDVSLLENAKKYLNKPPVS
jgi:hypothetical protein